MAVLDGEIRYQRQNDSNTRQVYRTCCISCHEDMLTSIPNQPRFQISAAAEIQSQVTESESPRSASATSSLAYYFSNPSREDLPTLSSADAMLASTTPETRLIGGPMTPGRDPAGIDRQGLIGVGELATPRWARGPRHRQVNDDREDDDNDDDDDDVDDGNDLTVRDDEKDGPDSPWTIEAVNSESEEKDEVISCLLCIYPLVHVLNIVTAHRSSTNHTHHPSSTLNEFGKWWRRNSLPAQHLRCGRTKTPFSLRTTQIARGVTAPITFLRTPAYRARTINTYLTSECICSHAKSQEAVIG
jgi:cytochrome c553